MKHLRGHLKTDRIIITKQMVPEHQCQSNVIYRALLHQHKTGSVMLFC